MDADERHFLLNVALKAQALLDRFDTLTTDEFQRGGERAEREALRCALAGCTKGCWHHEDDTPRPESPWSHADDGTQRTPGGARP